jgi:hypothetical protein
LKPGIRKNAAHTLLAGKGRMVPEDDLTEK